MQNHLPATAAARSRSLPLAQSQSFALPLLFTVFGVIMGSWAGRIPAMAERVHVSHSALSMVLLCGGLGAVLSYPISSRMMSSLGARKTMLISGLALLAVLVAIGGAPTGRRERGQQGLVNQARLPVVNRCARLPSAGAACRKG